VNRQPEDFRAHQLINRIAHVAGSAVGGTDMADLGDGVRDIVKAAQDAFLAGTATTCRHSPSADSPQTAVAAAWRPGLITCEGCTFLFDDGPAVLRQLACSVCRAPITGDSPGRQPWSAGVQLNQLIVMVDLCGACLPATTDPAKPPAIGSDLRMQIRARGRRGRGRGKGRR
jgi:hypothetical protein